MAAVERGLERRRQELLVSALLAELRRTTVVQSATLSCMDPDPTPAPRKRTRHDPPLELKHGQANCPRCYGDPACLFCDGKGYVGDASCWTTPHPEHKQ